MEQAVLKIFHTTSNHLTWRWIVLHVQHLILKESIACDLEGGGDIPHKVQFCLEFEVTVFLVQNAFTSLCKDK